MNLDRASLRSIANVSVVNSEKNAGAGLNSCQYEDVLKPELKEHTTAVAFIPKMPSAEAVARRAAPVRRVLVVNCILSFG